MFVNKIRHLAAVLCTAAAATHAAPLTPAELPPAARDWLPWALQGQPPLGCPAGAAEGEAPVCVWPGRLQLTASAREATFRLEVQVFGAPARVALPGEAGAWPQDVKAGGKALPVVEADNRPGVWLTPGAHVLEGRIAWGEAMPQNLAVPAGLAAIVVTSDGATQTRAPDGDGRIWLRAVASPAEATDSLSVQTVRLVDDDQPLMVTTAFELRVAGRARAVELPLAVLPGLRAVELNSPLPARLAEDGRLVVQARPGNWHLELRARLSTPVQALKLPDGAREEEVWVVKAQPGLRLIRPEGPAGVDPRQVEMPEAWRSLPAFRLKPGETLKLTELQRGNAKPAPDALRLNRRLWLDFDGQGLTAHDRFEGQLTASSRLDMPAPGLLGRAALQGQDQPITRLSANGPAGFEVRERDTRVEADSRWPSGTALPASGWAVSVNALRAQLQLPPGWRLLHAQGPSRAEGAWVALWTLWDFFFVLLAALAAYRLLGWRVGALLAVALALTWHTPGSPPAVLWFALLALTALAQVLPAGRVQAAFARGRIAVAVLLGLVLLPFAVDQVRESIYPSLEQVGHQTGLPALEVAAPAPAVIEERVASSLKSKAPPEPRDRMMSYSTSNELARVDPNARVQTGPGLPTWTWRSHVLTWSGPVTPEQTLRLWLLPPWATALMKLTGLALLALALTVVAGMRPPRLRPVPAGGAAAALLLALLVTPTPSEATTPVAPAGRPAAADTADTGRAAWPSGAQLEALRSKVAAPPDCLPRCAELARLMVSAAGASVQLRAEIHAQALVAVPLPGQGNGWQPGSVTLDGQPAAVRRNEQGQLLVAVPPGVHQVVLTADVGSAAGLDIALPLPPRALQADLKGWTLAGLDPRGQSTGAITLSREPVAGSARAEDAGTQRDALPPLVRVDRQLQLGLRWQVTTHIERLAPSRAPLRVSWALLPGEAVSDARVTVDGSTASLQLGGEDAADVDSSLKPSDTLALVATQEPNQVERWMLDASTQWHVDASGLAATALQQDGRWLPEWRPWPGETLKLAVRKPAGVAGQTLTLDSARTAVTPGERSTDLTLALKLRASLGGPQRLALPAGAELLSVSLNGSTLPLQLRDGALTLPLTPGEQQVEVRWREPAGMGLVWRHDGLALGLPGVNDALTLNVPEDRIVLAVGGPLMGPAVLIWGVLAVVLVLAWFVPRGLPGVMARPAWLILALGVAPVSLGALGVLAGWFALLEARRRWAQAVPQAARWQRVGMQLLIVMWTLLAIGSLLDVLRTGLLGYPDLLVAGPESTSQLLSWFSDRFTDRTASAWVLSAPTWLYRALMLAWALWLAVSLLKWVGWAWRCFSEGGAWPARPADAPAAPEQKETP
ncbi:MAG: M50 family metallopeptidase [Pelomonas sp.]|nr:M50 family metallopeptidase [Roseateles sp.]